MEDVLYGRALGIQRSMAHEITGLRISPIGVIDGRKFHTFHDLTFEGAGERTSVKGDTNFPSAPKIELGHVLRESLLRVLCLRQSCGPTARVVLSKVDVASAFR